MSTRSGRGGARRRRRESLPSPELRCVCGHQLRRYWRHCPNCARALQWRDESNVTGAECYSCGWLVSRLPSSAIR